MDVINRNDCTGCMACFNKCPVNAINIIDNKQGFRTPIIDEKKCIKCNICAKVCPVIKNDKEKEKELKEEKVKEEKNDNENHNKIDVYACKNKDIKIRMESSSGGVFSIIAGYIIKKGGVVVGAKFDERFNVVHDISENIDQLKKFRGSKYVQSEIKEIFKKVEKYLKEERFVLFTGTPCQVEGLISYLGKSYEKLYTQDFICHGVPSPKVWRKYLEYLKNNGELKEITFRSKSEEGWNNYYTKYTFDNGEESKHHSKDIYMNLFLKNLILRKSCFNCRFKKEKRISDITIGDFWGIKNIDESLNDETGVSVIMLNSEKAKELFQEINKNLEYYKANIEDIKKYNSCFIKSTNYNQRYDEFFEDLDNLSIKELEEKYI